MQTVNNNQIARSVRFDIAADKTDEFNRLFKTEVLPMMQKQDGFKNELLLIQNDHVLAISVWKDLEAAKKYEMNGFPMITKALTPVLKTAPKVETFHYNALSTIS